MTSQRHISIKGRGSYKFATGRHAIAECPVCAEQIAYSQLVKRWDGQYVCPSCNDPRHPQETPVRAKDAIALHHPRPGRTGFGATVRLSHATLGFGIEAAEVTVSTS